MTLITILIVLGMQRYFEQVILLYQYGWFERYLRSVATVLSKTVLWQGYSGLFSIVIPILIVLALLIYIIHGWLFGLLGLGLNIIVLLFCIDGRDSRARLEDYMLALEKQDLNTAVKYAEVFLGEVPDKAMVNMTRQVTRTIFLRFFDNVFALLFWFVLFELFGIGVLGVVFYYIVYHLSDCRSALIGDDICQAAARVKTVLDWVPARLLGLSYFLMGHFTYAVNQMGSKLLGSLDYATAFAIDAGFATMGIDQATQLQGDSEENNHALAVVNRTLVLWIVILALFTITAWIT